MRAVLTRANVGGGKHRGSQGGTLSIPDDGVGLRTEASVEKGVKTKAGECSGCS